MPIIDARDIIAAPGGDFSDSIPGDVHFNDSTLSYWNYTLYSNGTLSNGSWCLLVFEPYTPKLLYPNGTFINATWCYTPINPIGLRGGIGLGFAVAFGFGLLLTLVNLTKHGRLYLPPEKRFGVIGRRWPWYWIIFVCAAAMISLLTNIDVDRYYLPELPIVLTSFFWFIMQLGAMAVVWEAVRHWGSWMERQIVDENSFALRQDDRRAWIEFWVPLVFYLWFWLNFFLVIPRNWGPIELQRSPDQTDQQAVPTATDIRFKAGAFFLFACWLTTVFSILHSLRHYHPRTGSILRRILVFFRHASVRFIILIPLGLAVVAFQALVSWQFQYSPLNVHASVIPIYVGGYLPALLIVYTQVVSGLFTPNEDLEIIRQRRLRGEEMDRDMGVVRKPAWWRRVQSDFIAPASGSGGDGMRDRIARNVREVGGGRATARNIEWAIETRTAEAEAAANNEGIEMTRMGRGGRDDSSIRGPPPPYQDRGRTVGQPHDQSHSSNPPRSVSTGTGHSTLAPKQEIRSMLDI